MHRNRKEAGRIAEHCEIVEEALLGCTKGCTQETHLAAPQRCILQAHPESPAGWKTETGCTAGQCQCSWQSWWCAAGKPECLETRRVVRCNVRCLFGRESESYPGLHEGCGCRRPADTGASTADCPGGLSASAHFRSPGKEAAHPVGAHIQVQPVVYPLG